MGGVVNPTQEANWPIIGTKLHQETKQQVTEANLGYSPQSSKILFKICAKYNLPIIVAPLDLTHAILATESELGVINEVRIRAADLVAKIMAAVPTYYQNLYRA